MAKSKLDKIIVAFAEYGLPCNYNAREAQGDTDFGSMITKALHQPSWADLNKSRDTRRKVHYLFGVPLNRLPKKRRAVMFKIDVRGSKIILHPNPDYRNMVIVILRENSLGGIVEIGDDINYKPNCWEDFGPPWYADPREL